MIDVPRRGLALGVAASALVASAEPSRAQSTELRFAVTDIVGLENLQREWGPFQKALKDSTGIDFRFSRSRTGRLPSRR